MIAPIGAKCLGYSVPRAPFMWQQRFFFFGVHFVHNAIHNDAFSTQHAIDASLKCHRNVQISWYAEFFLCVSHNSMCEIFCQCTVFPCVLSHPSFNACSAIQSPNIANGIRNAQPNSMLSFLYIYIHTINNATIRKNERSLRLESHIKISRTFALSIWSNWAFRLLMYVWRKSLAYSNTSFAFVRMLFGWTILNEQIITNPK